AGAGLEAAAEHECAAERAGGFEEGRQAGAEAAATLLAEATAKAEQYFAALELRLPELVLDAVERILGARDPEEVAARAVAAALREQRAGLALTPHVAS